MEKKCTSNYSSESTPAIPPRVRDLRMDFEHISRPLKRHRKKRQKQDQSPLSLPSIYRPHPCVRLPQLSSHREYSQLHSIGTHYTVLPPIRKNTSIDLQELKETDVDTIAECITEMTIKRVTDS